MHKHNAVAATLHNAASILGSRRATTAGEHVKPKVGVKDGKAAAAVLGSHSHDKKKKKK